MSNQNKEQTKEKLSSDEMFSRAFAYMVDGYSVIPVGDDKRPLLRSWKQYQEEAADEDQLEQWFTKDYPKANIGIVTGRVSNLTVIDVDTYKDAKTNPNIFPNTFTVQTGNGGYQLYYEYQEGLTISAGAYPQYPAVDIRSDGGYVVAPPSVTHYLDRGTGEWKGGEYTVKRKMEMVPFPKDMFPEGKQRKKITDMIGAKNGSRNDNAAAFSGLLLRGANPEVWETEVYPAVQRANMTFETPLDEDELRATFESISQKEMQRRNSLVVSPFNVNGEINEINASLVPEGTDPSAMSEIMIPIRKSGNGTTYKDMANVVAVLSHHPFYKGTIKYNEFRQAVEYNGEQLTDGDIIKIQNFLQVDGQLQGISINAVESGIAHVANLNKYDEVKDWVKSLEWDGEERLKNWLSIATNIEDDAYHSGIGAQWFLGMMRRIMEPGCSFDYLLVFVGDQGIGKTGLFRLIGGKWYKSYTGAIDNKDFYLTLRGALLLDLDEGAAMYKSEAIKIKSIITETHDEFRAPFGRVMQKFPRRFVFSMSTNDTEPFRDVTGNRRYWVFDGNQVNFQWVKDNRDQLFAEAYHCWKNKIELPEVPQDRAKELQENHLHDDSWTDIITAEIMSSEKFRKGSRDYGITVSEVFEKVFPNENLARLNKPQEMRICSIFKKLGLEKAREMFQGNRRTYWKISEAKIKEIQEQQKINR